MSYPLMVNVILNRRTSVNKIITHTKCLDLTVAQEIVFASETFLTNIKTFISNLTETTLLQKRLGTIALFEF